MKKMLLIALLMGVTAGIASAQVSINWAGPSGFAMPSDDGVLASGDAIAQLIFTLSGTPARPDVTGPLGDNSIWDTRTVTEAATGNPFAAGFSFVYSDPTFTPGSVFVRVFEGGADPLTAGTIFYDGPTFSVADDPDPNQIVDAGAVGSGGGPFGTQYLGGIGSYGFEQSVIPEPSVFAMLGLGGMFLMIRRRFVKA